jgi:hypothetical protein
LEEKIGVGHSEYYSSDAVFEDDKSIFWNEIEKSHARFCQIGFSESESTSLVASGYSSLSENLVVDRFYGGALSRYDMRTRFTLDSFKNIFRANSCRLPVYRATNIIEFYRRIDYLKTQNLKPLVFRGQTNHYRLERAISNPAFYHQNLGETSLLPSVWRRVLKSKAAIHHAFRDLSMLEWSMIMYDPFDVEEVHAREQALELFPGSFYVDELPDEPKYELIRNFHEHRNAFLGAYESGHGPLLLTILQHYGLYSPVLDLTKDPEVALFFSTHKFSKIDRKSRYEFVGSNDRQAIVYVLRQDATETVQYERDKLLEVFDPQRPKRQQCVIMPTNQYAMNLPGDFLVEAIHLDFDITEPGRYRAGDLFPSASEDRMLAALKNRLKGAERNELTEFA